MSIVAHRHRCRHQRHQHYGHDDGHYPYDDDHYRRHHHLHDHHHHHHHHAHPRWQSGCYPHRSSIPGLHRRPPRKCFRKRRRARPSQRRASQTALMCLYMQTSSSPKFSCSLSAPLHHGRAASGIDVRDHSFTRSVCKLRASCPYFSEDAYVRKP